MNTTKMINTENISFKDATLLSTEEAERIPDDIRRMCNSWWLRSPGHFTDLAVSVGEFGHIFKFGYYVSIVSNNVRPALQLDHSSLDDGTNLKIGRYGFTVVCDGKYALCDTSIGKSAFRKDAKAEDANDYETSDVKKVIDEWFEKEIKVRQAGIEHTTSTPFKGATILSVEEVEKIPQGVFDIDHGFYGWWLRPSKDIPNNTASVNSKGRVHINTSGSVNAGSCGIRPALQLNPDFAEPVSDGTRLRIGRYYFTVVCNKKYALCDTLIGKSEFRKDYKADDYMAENANDFEASDIKKAIDKWFENEIKYLPVDILDASLSEEETEKYLQMEGIRPHKKHRFDDHTCGHCGRKLMVNDNYCPDCGYRILWNSCRCLTENEDDPKQKRPLSELRKMLAIKQMKGIAPKFHKGIHGKKHDHYTCGNCGVGVAKEKAYCSECGFKMIWKENKAEATKKQKTATPTFDTSMFDFFNDDISVKPA